MDFLHSPLRDDAIVQRGWVTHLEQKRALRKTHRQRTRAQHVHQQCNKNSGQGHGTES